MKIRLEYKTQSINDVLRGNLLYACVSYVYFLQDFYGRFDIDYAIEIQNRLLLYCSFVL